MKRLSIYKSWKNGEWEVHIRDAAEGDKASINQLSDTHAEIIYEGDDIVAFKKLKNVMINDLGGEINRCEKLIKGIDLLTPKLDGLTEIPVIVGDRVFLLYEQVHARIVSIYSDKQVSYILDDDSIRQSDDFVIDNDLEDIRVNDTVFVWLGGYGITDIVEHCNDESIYVLNQDNKFSRKTGKNEIDQNARIVRKL